MNLSVQVPVLYGTLALTLGRIGLTGWRLRQPIPFLLGLACWASGAQGGEVWVVNTGSHDVSVIETTTHRVVATISVGQQPRHLSFTPDGHEAWVTNLGSRDITIIDAEAKRVVVTLAPGGRPHDVGFSA